MSVNFNETPADSVLNTPSDTPMFGPTPIWERSGKRRGRGRVPVKRPVEESPRHAYVAPERATFAEPAASMTMPAEPLAPLASEAWREPGLDTTRPRTSQARRGAKSGVSPIAVAAGVVVIVGLGAAGFYALQPQAPSGDVMTPSAATPSTATIATAPAAPAPSLAGAPTPMAPVEVAGNDARPTPARTVTRRAAPAATVSAMSADQASADVSATAADPGQAGALDTIDYGVDAPAAQPAMAPQAPASDSAPAAAAPATPEIMATDPAPMTVPTP